MAVHIRLARGGTKKRPFYRVVVADQRSPRNGRFLDNVGTFDPVAVGEERQANALKLDLARVEEWTKNGAVPSATVAKLIKQATKAAGAAAAAAK